MSESSCPAIESPHAEILALMTSGQYAHALALACETLERGDSGLEEQGAVGSMAGACLIRLGRLVEALTAFQNALAACPALAREHLPILHNLGGALLAQEHYAQAEAAFRLVLAYAPALPITHYNLGNLLRKLDRLDEAEASYRTAIHHQPGYPDAQFNLSTLLLETAHFDEAWPLYEARYARPDAIQHRTQEFLRCPRWRGESSHGRRLLVWQEDGLGDMIQFGRYLPWLRERAGSIHVACVPALHRLYASIPGVDQILDHQAGMAASETYDGWTSVTSLPGYRDHAIGRIPPAVYLKAAPEDIDRWYARLTEVRNGTPLIGLIWKGNPRHFNDRHRSLESLTSLAPLWQVQGMRFISLQKGQGEDEARFAPPDQALLHLGTELTDLADSAAVIAQLDLVITVDTAMAHLAGSLGVPCWVMLPYHNLDWRWLHALPGEELPSPWYPDLRLFRRQRNEDWAAVIERVRHALENWRPQPGTGMALACLGRPTCS